MKPIFLQCGGVCADLWWEQAFDDAADDAAGFGWGLWIGPFIGDAMANGFLELSDGNLLAWARSFGGHLTATPERYGISSQDAADFDVLLNAYADALEANSPGTRSMTSTLTKNQARAALLADARLLVQRINGYKPLTDAERLDLGIPPRAKATATGAPQETPVLTVQHVDGNRVTISIGRQGRKGSRLPGAIGATVFWAVGDNAPTTMDGWTFAGNTSGRRVEITLPPHHAPGTRVWLTACWLSPRLEAGPLALPIGAQLQFPTTMRFDAVAA